MIFYTYWTYSVTFNTDIERGIQIFWTTNRGAVSQWKIVKEEKDCGYRANNFSLGNSSVIHSSKDLNATFNVGGKSNWVCPLSLLTFSDEEKWSKKMTWFQNCEKNRVWLLSFLGNCVLCSFSNTVRFFGCDIAKKNLVCGFHNWDEKITKISRKLKFNNGF